MSEELDRIEARAAKYHVRSALPQVEDLQDDRDYLLTLARKQAAALEAVKAVIGRFDSAVYGMETVDQTGEYADEAIEAIRLALEATS